MAVLKSIDKNITLDEVKDILINTSEDIDAVGYDINSGYGIVNIKGAVEYFLKSKNIYQNNIYTKMMDNTLFTNVNLIYRNSENADLITVLRDSIGRIRDIEVLDATNSELKNFEYTYNTENLESGEYNIEYYLLGRDSVSPFYDKRVITFTKE